MRKRQETDDNCEAVKVGLPGRDGRDGPSGQPGPPGTAGAVGSPGRDGRDAVCSTQQTGGGEKGEKGFPGTDGTPGPPGADGTPGPPGVDGTPGPPGADGTTGPPGADGTPGPPGVGAKGQKGARGIVGPKGDTASSGAVYVRWGKTTCPSGADVVYSGRAAGAKYDHKGGTSDHHCLPNNPQYLFQDTANTWVTQLYGVEYEMRGSTSPYNSIYQADMPCVVCNANGRSQLLMVPARYTCPTGWSREYYGYMMTEGVDSARGGRKTTICVDDSAEAVPGSGTRTNPSPGVMMRANCNGIPCPPYQSNKLLTCAVCTK